VPGRIEPSTIPYVDVHVHAVEYSDSDWKKIESLGASIIVAVAEDVESSKATLDLAESRHNVYPCIGIHPWNCTEARREDVDAINRLISRMKRPCIGEVGLDLKFVPQSIEKQREVFRRMVELAVEYDAVLNLHAAGAWSEVFHVIDRLDVEKAVFHWYTGPLDLIRDITERGFYISVNAAARIQEKQRRVIEATPLEYILSESDGPYQYRGIRLTTEMMPELVQLVSKVKGVDRATVLEQVWLNLKRLFET